MALEVDPGDLKDNQNELARLQKLLQEALADKESLLATFQRKMKQLEKDEKILNEIFKTAGDRVRHHGELKKDIEKRLAGKRDAKLEAEDDRRVKHFIGVVGKEESPRFGKALKEFKADLAEIEEALK